MILTTEVYREFLKLMKKRTGDTYTREEYDNFTELKYAYDLCCILGGGRWEDGVRNIRKKRKCRKRRTHRR